MNEFYRPTPEEQIPPSTWKSIERVIGIWGLSMYAVAKIFDSNPDYLSVCSLCDTLSSYIPAIERMSSYTDFPAAARAVWTYIYISAPFVVMILFRKSRTINYAHQTLRYSSVFGFLWISSSFILFIGVEGELHGRYSEMFTHSLFGLVIITTSFAGMWILSSINLLGILHSLGNCRSPRRNH